MKTFTIEVTADEVNLIGAGLAEMPMKLALPLVKKLQEQVSKQEKTSEAESGS
jgi:hypothetical protein